MKYRLYEMICVAINVIWKVEQNRRKIYSSASCKNKQWHFNKNNKPKCNWQLHQRSGGGWLSPCRLTFSFVIVNYHTGCSYRYGDYQWYINKYHRMKDCNGLFLWTLLIDVFNAHFLSQSNLFVNHQGRCWWWFEGYNVVDSNSKIICRLISHGQRFSQRELNNNG